MKQRLWRELTWIREGFSENSLLALSLLVGLYVLIAFTNSGLVDPSAQMDWPLVWIWVVLTLLCVWRIRWKEDGLLFFVGFVGGTCIEIWGTHTGLWWYFTGEKPPFYILPAWPIAGLATHRLALFSQRYWPGTPPASLTLLTMGAFCAMMIWFSRDAELPLLNFAALGTMTLLIAVERDARKDLELFLLGAGAGYILEWWCTTREVYTYYTLATPPWQTVLAHGYATVMFGKGFRFLKKRLLTPRS